MFRASFLLVLIGLLAGCGGGDKDEKIAGWLGPPRAPRSGDVEVGSFNRYADDAADPSFELSALRTALEFLALDNRPARTTSVVLNQPPEGADEAEVTATLDGLLDDFDSSRAVPACPGAPKRCVATAIGTLDAALLGRPGAPGLLDRALPLTIDVVEAGLGESLDLLDVALGVGAADDGLGDVLH